MQVFDSLMVGLASATQLPILMYCLLGVFLGTFVGVLPGIGPLAAISLLLPITYHMEPTAAIVLLAGIYYGSEYGGSTASILLNLPGTAANAITCLDGHPMAKQGRAGVALFMTTIASLVGGVVGVLMLIFFAPSIVQLGLEFGPSEYFALLLLGVVGASMLVSGSPAKGLAMVVIGLILGTVGIDPSSGVPRFDFGFAALLDGISLLVVAMGLFGIAEIIKNISAERDKVSEKITLRSMTPTKNDFQDSSMPMVRGACVGSFLGALPGTGAAIASFAAYAVEKKCAKDPSKFGKGAIQGLTAPEAANNAACQAAFIPTLTLGIPGSATMAVMIGALILHGIQPGPLLMINEPSLFWGLVVSFFIGNIFLVVLNIPLIGIWVSTLNISSKLLYPAILIFIMIGLYSVKNSTFDLYMVTIIGFCGYAMVILRFEAAPLLLGFVLGPMMEENLRRALLLSRGDLSTFVDGPISAGLISLSGAIVIWSIVRFLRNSFTKGAKKFSYMT